ncbi:MAG: putative Fe-S cluster assembly protein SufT [Gammaproteobacteria bacterium]|nr:putative Fe-S cluster assembly protein SufT [Gammaproteobacteria bacterium]
MESDTIQLKRDVNVVTVPEGLTTTLQEGETVSVMQSLGNSITLTTEHGGMVRLAGIDADAIGREPIVTEGLIDKPDAKSLEANIWKLMQGIYDPEIPVNIAELGLIYDINIKPVESDAEQQLHDVDVVMTLTAPGCGMGPVLQTDVDSAIKQLQGVSTVKVDVVFDPPWSRDMMSEAAQLQLGMF